MGAGDGYTLEQIAEYGAHLRHIATVLAMPRETARDDETGK